MANARTEGGLAMKKLSTLLCCLAISAAPHALAQTAKPAATPTPQTPPPGRVVTDMKQDPRLENCKSEAATKNLRGEALENFMTKCMK
jgi:hypothetical protein